MNLIISMFVALFNTLVNHTMLTRKKSITYCIIAFLINSIIVIAVLVGVNQLVNDIGILKYLFCLVMFLYIGYLYLVFEESLFKKLFVMFSTWVISAIILTISILISKQFVGFENQDNVIYFFRILLQLALILFLARKWFRENYKRVLSLVQDKTINLMSIYMIVAFLILLNNLESNQLNLKNFTSMYDLSLFFVFITLGYVIVFTGISTSSRMVLLEQAVEMSEKKSKMHYEMANIDSLTGIASRFNILNQITKAITDDDVPSQRFAILMLDIDKFKLINDNYGHRAGDEVLKFLTKEISSCLSETDSIGRVGGDEFIILIRNIRQKQDVEKVIFNIFERLKTPYSFEQQAIPVKISIGISIFPDNAKNLDSLINLADHEMYKAKKIEGSNYHFFV